MVLMIRARVGVVAEDVVGREEWWRCGAGIVIAAAGCLVWSSRVE